MAILVDGHLDVFGAKTAVCLLRYRANQVVALIDGVHAGRVASSVLGVGGGVPIVATLAEARALGAGALVIGVAPRGGDLPPSWRAMVTQAVDAGLDLISGLHVFFADDPELAARAHGSGSRLVDLRRPPAERALPPPTARADRPLVVMTVGSDCNVGKMTAAVEIVEAAQRAGIDARFAATGQTGILLAGSGVPIDRVIADFTAGAAAALVAGHADAEWVVVEGQGALGHPAYSAVTLGLLHGARPHQLVLCHQVARQVVHGYDRPIPGPAALVRMYEEAAGWIAPARVAVFALNPIAAGPAEVEAYAARVATETGLLAYDPIAAPASIVETIRAQATAPRQGGR